MTTIVVAPTSVAMFPEGGGHFWVFLQWIRGLQRNGCDVYWLECLEPKYERQPDTLAVRTFLQNLDRVDLHDRALVYQERSDGSIEYVNIDDARGWAILDRADLLLNFKYDISTEILGRVRRSALIDIDPGLLQFWLSHDQLTMSAHDVYFTTGEHVDGQSPDGRKPEGAMIPWHQIRPVVDTASWQFDDGPRRETFTTVTNWFGEWLTDGAGWLLDNSKRVEFLAMADLPQRTTQPLELAVCLGDNPDDVADRSLMERKGWLIRHSFEVSRDPFLYQEYIRSSRGEFSCVKPSCLMFRNAWISDRTLCYLASGRPAIIQHTGPSDYLPDADGLFRFVTIDEAVEALSEVNRDYERHCRSARNLAETYFDAAEVSSRVLETALP